MQQCGMGGGYGLQQCGTRNCSVVCEVRGCGAGRHESLQRHALRSGRGGVATSRVKHSMSRDGDRKQGPAGRVCSPVVEVEKGRWGACWG